MVQGVASLALQETLTAIVIYGPYAQNLPYLKQPFKTSTLHPKPAMLGFAGFLCSSGGDRSLHSLLRSGTLFGTNLGRRA